MYLLLCCLYLDYLLAGKYTEAGKVKEARKRTIEVVSLIRVQRLLLLLGELTFETMSRQPRPSKDAFKDDTYHSARVIATQTVTTDAQPTE